MKGTLVFLSAFILIACSSGREAIMPYRNMIYEGEKNFPIQKNESETCIRFWINNSTSIDRIITISKDSSSNYKGYLVEMGVLYNGKKKNEIYKNHEITPKSGFQEFFKKIDSLNILNYDDQEDFELAYDRAFSLYVIEYKKNGIVKQLIFNTNFPSEYEKENKYDKIQELIFNEFDLKLYFK